MYSKKTERFKLVLYSIVNSLVRKSLFEKLVEKSPILSSQILKSSGKFSRSLTLNNLHIIYNKSREASAH